MGAQNLKHKGTFSFAQRSQVEFSLISISPNLLSRNTRMADFEGLNSLVKCQEQANSQARQPVQICISTAKIFSLIFSAFFIFLGSTSPQIISSPGLLQGLR